MGLDIQLSTFDRRAAGDIEKIGGPDSDAWTMITTTR